MGVRKNLLSHDTATEFQFLVITDLYKEGTEKLCWPLAVIGYIGTKHTAGTVFLFSVLSIIQVSSDLVKKAYLTFFLPFFIYKLVVLLTSLASHQLAVTLLVAPAGGSFLCGV